MLKATGDTAPVYPVLAIPGWFVERTSATTGILVANPKEIRGVLKRMLRVLDDSGVQRVAFQVEQKCRDVEPRAYKEGKK